MARTLSLGLAAVVLVVAAAQAAPPAVRLVARPATVTVGQPWHATLETRAAGTPTLVARLGQSTRRFPARRTAPNRFRARVVLPAPGRWRLDVQLRSRRYPVGAVLAVRAQPEELLLRQPTSAALGPDGSLLVAEAGRGRVVRIDPATGRTRSMVTGLRSAYGVAVAPDGALLVTDGPELLRIDPTSGARARLAATGLVDFGPLVVRADGTAYAVVSPGSILRIAPGGGQALLQVGLDAPHGLLLHEGSLLLADTRNGRVVGFALDTWSPSVLAAGLGAPGPLASQPNGRLLVADMSAGALLALEAAGPAVRIAGGLEVPVGMVARDGLVYVVSTDGRVRVVRGAAVSTLRLHAASD